MAIPRSFQALVVGFVLLIVGLAAPANAADTPLRWKLKPGETLRFEFRQKNENKGKGKAIGGQASDYSNEGTTDLSWTVDDVDEQGRAEITLVVQRVKTETRIGTTTTRFDSNDKENKPVGASKSLKAIYDAVIGTKITLTLDARGQVVEAKVPAKITEALQSSPFLATADASSLFSDKGVKNLFSQVIPVLPESQIEPGASWSSKLELPVPPMRLTLTYHDRLTAIETTSAKIEADIETAVVAEPNSPFSIDVKTQSGHRVTLFDTSRGRLTASTVKQTYEVTLKVMNREIEQVVVGEAHLKLVP